MTDRLTIDPDLLGRLSKPGPRYTSYPTAVVFNESFGPDAYATALSRLGASGRPVSLYVHLPFCRSLCHYCACNVIISQKPGVASGYLDLLEKEAQLVGAALGAKPRASQVHLGGGTPTYLTTDELRRMHGILAAQFDMSSADEMAVEVDPRVTTREQLEVLAELGWNRASFGVQDFDPEVQHAVNRVQSVEETEALVTAARELGYAGINVDLIYGLPFQKVETFNKTLDEVLRIRPDRVALYSYAHVPWMKIAQTRFEKRGYPMPGPQEKCALFSMGVEAFTAAGYEHLGMDHFALPEDELTQARNSGSLHRNFQGYTVKRADDMVALGISAISDLAGVYAQNSKELDAYEQALTRDELPTCRGWELTEDDHRRREAITALMTGSPYPPGYSESFPEVLETMKELEADGLIRRAGPEGLDVTPLGRFFIRNVAMPFDAYLRNTTGSFSKTV